MAQVVEYILSLRDDLSRGIQGANTQVNHLESSLGSARSAIGSLTGMLGTLGVGFALFKGAAFVHDGVEAFHRVEQSMAQVEAGLKSTGEAAGMTKESISSMAKEMSSRMKFGRADILDMQAQMLTFGGITKENFPAIGDAIANVATKIGMDLHGMAIQFGKAMDNPADGIKKLMRQGVMFSQQQEDAIDKLVEKGNIVGAQQIMLAEIANKYGGASQAAFDADPLSRYDKTMGSVKMTVGELATDLLIKLTPALEAFANIVKTAADWVKKNGTELWVLIKAVVEGVLIFKTITLVIVPFAAALTTVAPAAAAAVTGIEAVGVASTFALGPIGLLAAAVTAVIYSYGLLEAAQKKMENNRTKLLSDAGEAELKHDNASLAGAISVGQKKSDAIKQIFDERMSHISSRRKELEAEWKTQGTDNGISGSAKDFQEQWNFKKGILDAQELALKDIGRVMPTKLKSVVALPKKEDPAAKTKAVGSKSVTINVSIKDLVNTLQINTTNLKEGAGKVQEIITNILASAVNDFQIVAGGH